MKRCSNPNCGTEGEGRFCQQCGHKMVEPEGVSLASSIVIICSGKNDDGSPCGAELKATQKFCGDCGILVDTRLFETVDICGNCGKNFGPGKKFCFHCGARKAENKNEDLQPSMSEPRSTGDKDEGHPVYPKPQPASEEPQQQQQPPTSDAGSVMDEINDSQDATKQEEQMDDSERLKETETGTSEDRLVPSLDQSSMQSEQIVAGSQTFISEPGATEGDSGNFHPVVPEPQPASEQLQQQEQQPAASDTESAVDDTKVSKDVAIEDEEQMDVSELPEEKGEQLENPKHEICTSDCSLEPDLDESHMENEQIDKIDEPLPDTKETNENVSSSHVSDNVNNNNVNTGQKDINEAKLIVAADNLKGETATDDSCESREAELEKSLKDIHLHPNVTDMPSASSGEIYKNDFSDEKSNENEESESDSNEDSSSDSDGTVE